LLVDCAAAFVERERPLRFVLRTRLRLGRRHRALDLVDRLALGGVELVAVVGGLASLGQLRPQLLCGVVPGRFRWRLPRVQAAPEPRQAEGAGKAGEEPSHAVDATLSAASCLVFACAVPAHACRRGRLIPGEARRKETGNVIDYEILLMLDPDLPEERQEEIVKRTRDLVEKGGGTW